MNEKQIRLRSREEVQDFVQAASNCNFDIDISYDRVIIDAKSFLGVLGLGVSRVFTVTYCGKDMDFADPFCMHYNERRHCAVPSMKSTTD